MVQYLIHSRRTNLIRDRVTNIDFVVLFLGQHGPSTLKSLYNALSQFRGKPLNSNAQVGSCNYLFNRCYAYVSYRFNPNTPWPQHFFTYGTPHPTLWYRTSRGTYALNRNGLQRLAQLQSS